MKSNKCKSQLNSIYITLGIFFAFANSYAIAAKEDLNTSELGPNDFIQEKPKRIPLLERGDSKYWNCSGLVHENFVKRVFAGISALERANGLKTSQISTCIYQQTRISAGGKTGVAQSVNFYISENHQKCIYSNQCGDMRSVSFFFGGKTPSFSFDLTNTDGSKFYGACTSMLDGSVLSATKNCMTK
jgi:hypothetical protein